MTTLVECKTKIEDLEETVKELKQELRDFRKDRTDHKFALRLMIWGVAFGFVSGMLTFLIQRILGF